MKTMLPFCAKYYTINKQMKERVKIMEHAFDFLSADGKHTVFTVSWEPQGTPKAILQITTGMVEYIERYLIGRA